MQKGAVQLSTLCLGKQPACRQLPSSSTSCALDRQPACRGVLSSSAHSSLDRQTACAGMASSSALCASNSSLRTEECQTMRLVIMSIQLKVAERLSGPRLPGQTCKWQSHSTATYIIAGFSRVVSSVRTKALS